MRNAGGAIASAPADARPLWLAMMMLTALLLAAAAGLARWHDGRRVGAALLCGGSAFGATVGLLLAVAAYLHPA